MRDFEAGHEEPMLELSSSHSKPRSLRRKNCKKPAALVWSGPCPFSLRDQPPSHPS
jgi:hypothetical protein